MTKNVLRPFDEAAKADNPNWRDENAARTITHTDFFDYMWKTVNKKTVKYDCSHARIKK